MEIFREWVSENADMIRQIAAKLGMSVEDTLKHMLDDVIDAYRITEDDEKK